LAGNVVATTFADKSVTSNYLVSHECTLDLTNLKALNVAHEIAENSK